MNSSSLRIGVFDSGVGGLSVLRHLIAQVPQASFVYLGDTARVPYGNKSFDTIARYAAESAAFFRTQSVDIVVVACNTVSAVALPVVETIAGVPVIGMIEPAVEAAVRTTRTGRIGVLGTRATIQSGAYEMALYAHAGSNNVVVFPQASPLLVALAEEGWIAHPATLAIIEEYIRPLQEEHVDTLILGCTHFPILADAIAEITPMQLIDPGDCAAETLGRMVGTSSNGSIRAPRVEYYLTDIATNFAAIALQFLGFEAHPIHRIELDHTVMPAQRP
ncbi:MAG: glutamate racemase [Chlorobi bacterium]|nr:glutamate racemase [Chlorobiota bacterium]